MNSSQLLYKISDLQYIIRMKKADYNNAVKANDTLKIDLYKTDIKVLTADLAKTVKELETISNDTAAVVTKDIKKKKKWQSFFTFNTVFNKK